jgi:uncharacterized phage protein (TIGR02218 family)
MAYSDFEISNADGQPVALYTFQYGNTYWYYCTADENQTVGGITYEALAITDEGVTQGGSDQNDLQIRTRADHPVALLFRNRQPSGKVWLSVRRWHIGDPDEETPLLWSGTIVNVVTSDRATAQLAGRSLGGSYDRNGLRLAWSRMCPHVLYGIGCNNSGSNAKEDHAYPHTIATVDGIRFTVTSYAAPSEGSFTGGFMEWIRDDGSLDRRGIESHDGNDFLVLGSTDGLEVGTAVTLYPGCPRNTDGCKRFNNLPNYGGFPHLPGKSPFDGTPVF